MQHSQINKLEHSVPFYLEENTVPFKKSTEIKRVTKQIPLTNSNLIDITPQKPRFDKSIELENLLSSIPNKWQAEEKLTNSQWEQMGKQYISEIVMVDSPKNVRNKEHQKKKEETRKISREIGSGEILDIRLFVSPPIQKNKVLKCTLRRDRSGMKAFYPIFELQTQKERKPLLFARKQAGNKTSNYRISLTKQDLESKGPNYMGKLRSNFFGTDYVVYDNGDNPKKVPHTSKPRRVLAQIHYQNKFIVCSSGPKKIEAYVPDPESPVESISDFRKLHKYNPNNIVSITNKLPQWNSKLGAYLLDFQDRATRPSIKNFILVHEENEEMIMLLLGKVDDDNFNLDIYHPLSVIQAFGMVLSMFDFKLASE